MKILAVVHQFLPKHRAGTEIHTDQLARALRRPRHEVVILACEHTASRRQYSLAEREYRGTRVIEAAFAHGIDDFERTYSNPEMNRVVGRSSGARSPTSSIFSTRCSSASTRCAPRPTRGPRRRDAPRILALCHRGTFLLENPAISAKRGRAPICARSAAARCRSSPSATGEPTARSPFRLPWIGAGRPWPTARDSWSCSWRRRDSCASDSWHRGSWSRTGSSSWSTACRRCPLSPLSAEGGGADPDRICGNDRRLQGAGSLRAGGESPRRSPQRNPDPRRARLVP